MELLTAHQRAQEAFGAVLAAVQPAQRTLPTPCPEWNVEQLVAHVVAGNRYAATGVRSTGEDDPVAAFPDSAAAAQAAWAAPGGLERTFQMPFGEISGTRYIVMRSTDAMCHAWDLARATGQQTDLDAGLAEELLSIARPLAAQVARGPQAPFGEVQPCGEDRPAADRLAAFFGRRVEV